MNFKKKLEKVAATVEKGVGHAREEIAGRLNPNRRHDEPHEKVRDELLAQIRAGHRFNSFASERTDTNVKWHIDGHDYMWALSEMLDNAKEFIFILDWWLTPEPFLRRPPAFHQEWRLDRVLKRKAEEGVKIHVIVYKEVTQTMAMSSSHTKHALERLHPNITCARHPDHIGAKDSVQLWSHHEKVVVVDNHFAAIGGLDLCFGRWDTPNHPLADVHPTHFGLTLFPGQDYNNARIMDFKEVKNYVSNTLSILESARMPWHDVHMTMTGPVVLDISQHFIERWNEVKARKYYDDKRFAWLALPHDPSAAPNEAVARHPFRVEWDGMGKKYKQRWHGIHKGEDPQNYPLPSAPGCRVQVVRSVSDWSHGVLTEHSIQNAYIRLIREAEHFIYIENQFFISATKPGGQIKNLIAQALVERIVSAAKDGAKFKVIIQIPELPGFAGDLREGSVKTILSAQYRTINRGGSSIYEQIRKAGYEPLDYIRFYHLRSYDRINAPLGSFIGKMEKKSGIRFHEAQVALARAWVSGDEQTDQKEVTVTIPQEATEGLMLTPKTPPKTETVPIPTTDDAALKVVERWHRGAEGLRGDEEVSDTVSQHMLHEKRLVDEKWLGTPEEELNAYVSELLYIHSKLMIVDDRRVIMGSANINDRSQKGDGDSEIALVIEDEDMVDSFMDGQPYKVSRFAATLRRKLFREHLGLIPPEDHSQRFPEATSFMRPAPFPNKDETATREDQFVMDPISDEMDLFWNQTAKKNREIFSELFRPVPTNLVRSLSDYKDYLPKVKTGHVVPGITLERLKSRLSQVRGSLVECPLDFLIDDKDFVSWRVYDPTLPIFL